MPRKYASLRERLNANSMEFVDAPSLELPCRLWTGGQNSTGRPKMTVRTRFRDPATGHRKLRTVSAARWSLAEFLGLPPYKLNHVLHKCNQPRCIEPTHLYSSTQQRNMEQMVKEGRHWRGERFNPRPKGHKGKALSKHNTTDKNKPITSKAKRAASRGWMQHEEQAAHKPTCAKSTGI